MLLEIQIILQIQANLDTRNAIFYIGTSEIRYGIIINVYRKNDSVNR